MLHEWIQQYHMVNSQDLKQVIYNIHIYTRLASNYLAAVGVTRPSSIPSSSASLSVNRCRLPTLLRKLRSSFFSPCFLTRKAIAERNASRYVWYLCISVCM